jgi:chaperonin GroEL
MRSRTLLYDLEARTKLKVGMDALSEMVKVTLGPKGNNVIIEKISGFPLITKDGVTVAREIYLSDPIENMGAQVLKEVAMKTNETAGDGTTTATVLAHAFITEGIKNLTAGSNPMDLKRGIDIAVKHVTDRLKELSRPVTGKEDIISVASISANNDNQIGNDIANSIEKAGNEGIVIVEDSKDSDTIIEVSEGMQIDRGYQHPYFINKTVTMEVELKGTYILFYNGKLHQMHDLARIAEAVIKKKLHLF